MMRNLIRIVVDIALSRSLVRILVGIALLYAAWCCYLRTVALINEASSRFEIPKAADHPDGDLDFFSQPNPLKDPPTQAELWKIREAQAMQLLCLLSGGSGLFLIALGLSPAILLIVAWLFIPDFMRRSHADPDRSDPPGDRPTGDEAGGEPEASAPDAV